MSQIKTMNKQDERQLHETIRNILFSLENLILVISEIEKKLIFTRRK